MNTDQQGAVFLHSPLPAEAARAGRSGVGAPDPSAPAAACRCAAIGCPAEPRAEENERRIGRALALCGDEPTGWPAMIAKILRGEAAAPPAQATARLVDGERS